MKKIVSVITAIFSSVVIVLFIVWLIPDYKHAYLESLDRKNVVTRLDYDGKTYFTYGRFEADTIPVSYIKPEYSGFTSGFEVILYFENDTAYLYAHYGKFTKKGDNDMIKTKVYEGYGNDPVFNNMKSDNSGKYQVISR